MKPEQEVYYWITLVWQISEVDTSFAYELVWIHSRPSYSYILMHHTELICFILQLLSKSLDVVESEDWIADLGEMFGSQIPLYNSYPEEKVTIPLSL